MSATITIRLIKSHIGKPESQRSVLRGLGLTKLNKRVTLMDTPEVRGMVNKVSHMISIEE